MKREKWLLVICLFFVFTGNKIVAEEKEVKEKELVAAKVSLPFVEEGKVGRCLKFDVDAAERVNCGNKDILNITDALTISFWVKGEEWFHCAGFVNKERAYQIEKRGINGGGIYFHIWINNQYREAIWPVEMFKLKENEWYHITFTYNSQTAIAKAYLNGKLMATGELKKSLPNLSNYKIDISSDDLILGSALRSLRGCLDEVYIYNRALSDEEIGKIYKNQEISKEGLVGLWKFEEGEGKKTSDLSGNGNTGIIITNIMRANQYSEKIVVNGISIVEKGKVKTEIIVDKNAFPITKSAAKELQRFLKGITGLEIPLLEVGEEIKIEEGINPIFVGESFFTKKLGISTQIFKPDEFKIFTEKNNLIIIGKDDNKATLDYSRFGNAGTVYGVYRFLEELGMRWYFPGEIGVVFPEKKEIIVKDIKIQEHPYFVYRNGSVGGSGMDYYWLRRVGFGGNVYPASTCHSFEHWHTKYKKDHPEWFALMSDGSRGNELCWYNLGAREQMLEQMRDFFRTKDPEIYPDFTMLRNDGAPPVCTCPECSKRVRPQEGSYGSLSDYITEVTIDLAKIIEKEFPDRRLVIGGYNDTTLPPVTIDKLPSNVSVHLHKCCLEFWSEEVKNNYYNGVVKGWLKLKPAAVSFWEYYNHDCWGGGKWFGVPCIASKFISDDFKRLKKLSEESNIPFLGEMIFADGRAKSTKRLYWLAPTFYVTGKLLWNPDLQVESIMVEFYEKFFGPAKEPMGKFYQRIEEVWTSGKWGRNTTYIRGNIEGEESYFSKNPWQVLFTHDILKELGNYLIQARKLATTSPYKERVEMVMHEFEVTLSYAKKYQESGVFLEELEKAKTIW